MMLNEETQLPDGRLPLAAFKAHLRLGSGFAEGSLQDEVLASFLRAAIAAIEARTDKAILARVFVLTVPAWDAPGRQGFRIAPVTQLTEIALIAEDGTRSVVPPEAVWISRDGETPGLCPVGAALPAIPARGQAELRFEAGIAADWADLPADLAQAVFLLAAHYYEYRDDRSLSAGCMPFGVTSLIDRFRTRRIGFGANR